MTRTLSEEINWKGIGDYLSAARTISEHGSSNTSGPKIHCQGLALELALKFYLWDKNGNYPGVHDLEQLAFSECQSINFSNQEINDIKQLNAQYVHDGEFPYPARYRPTQMRVFASISQDRLESVINKVIQNTKQPNLITQILKR